MVHIQSFLFHTSILGQDINTDKFSNVTSENNDVHSSFDKEGTVFFVNYERSQVHCTMHYYKVIYFFMIRVSSW